VKFILYVATTLDGYIATEAGGIDWLTRFGTNEENGYAAFYGTVDALVMGATTYEQVLGFGDWPYPGKRSYVLTHRNFTTNRDDISFVSSIAVILADAERRGLDRVWIVGGGKVASLLITSGLVDEYIVTVMPIILGAGISLYQAVPEQPLELIRTKSYASGAVELHYRKPAQGL
jgi:dihydrofolate reductase